jgi:two-component system sensor histidine kinase KdpD
VGSAEFRVLQGFADQAALAVNRTSLVEDATRVQALEQADELRSALMRSVSHDLRTPLASITAAAEDLADPDLHLESEDRQVLAVTIAEESRRLDKLVGELLDVSRIESGRLEVHPQVVDLADLIESAIAGRVQEQVQIDVGRDELLVRADPVLIGQVLQNLIDNAVRFSPPGLRPLVTARLGVGAVEVAVCDRGPGVMPAEGDQIFELFYSPTDGEGSRASGVGLAICEAFVAAHGGRIWVEDTPGGGATFVFTLPLALAPPEQPIERSHV